MEGYSMNWYDEGYESCCCFWGNAPGSLVLQFQDLTGISLDGKKILDIGAGEGKNAFFCANSGAMVDAVEISIKALNNKENFLEKSPRVSWYNEDARQFEIKSETYDIVISYGLYHCFPQTSDVIALVNKAKNGTNIDGYNVICCFNDRRQEMASAHPGFIPTLLSHHTYLNLYQDWEILYETDCDLTETHPHNKIEHTHSMTRMLARKTK